MFGALNPVEKKKDYLRSFFNKIFGIRIGTFDAPSEPLRVLSLILPLQFR